jgi:hypothetical protein
MTRVPKSGLPPVFVNELLLEHNLLILLHTAYRCFCTVAQLIGCDKAAWTTKPRIFTIWLIKEKVVSSCFRLQGATGTF